MTRKKDLAGALKAQDEKTGQGTETKLPPKAARSAASAKSDTGRNNKVNIAGWFPTNVKFELEELRLERSRAIGRKVTLQQIQAEAYNDLFKKYGRPELAPSAAK